MSNLVDVGIRPSNISRIVNVMNHGEGCEEVNPQQVIDFTRHPRSNISHEFISIIKYFQEKAESDLDHQIFSTMRAHLEAFFGLMEE